MKMIVFYIGLLLIISINVYGQVEEGKMYMIIACHSNKALEIKPAADITASGLQLQQDDLTGNSNQLFYFKKIKGSYFQIIAVCSNKSLEIRNGSLKDHDTVQQNQFYEQDCQLFTLIKNSNGTFAIVNKNSGYGFDILGGSKSFGNNTAVIQYSASGAPNQLFRIVEYDNNRNPNAEGLFRHPFLYTGEWDYRKTVQNIFVLRGGEIVWSYGIPFKNEKGEMEELGDATRLSNGNIVFCRKVGASEITPGKKIIWNTNAEPGCEIHSVQPLGLEKVLVVQNGNPAKAMIINITTNKIEKQVILPSGNPQSSHLQFRRVRLTKDSTLLAAHLDDNKVSEYDLNGKEIWSFDVNGPWSVVRLKNGNTLISSYPSSVLEVNKSGKVVWQFSEKDIPAITCFIFQEVSRLANGNTIICNWCPVHLKDSDEWPGTVQVLEVTPDKKVVWTMSQWKAPVDLGPASSIQLLDEPGIPENGELQR